METDGGRQKTQGKRKHEGQKGQKGKKLEIQPLLTDLYCVAFVVIYMFYSLAPQNHFCYVFSWVSFVTICRWQYFLYSSMAAIAAHALFVYCKQPALAAVVTTSSAYTSASTSTDIISDVFKITFISLRASRTTDTSVQFTTHIPTDTSIPFSV